MIGGEQIEEHPGIKVGFDVPYDGEGFVKAVNEAQPLVSMAHRSPAAAAIRRLAGHLTATSVETEDAPAPKRGGLFRDLFGRD
ncbi:MAG: hypothetical protein ABIP53_09730 [Candidatus Limnocylindrales bacterium]